VSDGSWPVSSAKSVWLTSFRRIASELHFLQTSEVSDISCQSGEWAGRLSTNQSNKLHDELTAEGIRTADTKSLSFLRVLIAANQNITLTLEQ
jgi:hypothetical protein